MEFIAGLLVCFLFLLLSNRRLKNFSNTVVFIDGRMTDAREILSRLDKSKVSKARVNKLKAVAYGRLQELEKVRGFISGGYKWDD